METKVVNTSDKMSVKEAAEWATAVLEGDECCGVCGDLFKPKHKNQKLCSKACRLSNLGRRNSWLILQRDNFCCIYCGASSIENPGTRLAVDHIHPKSKGGLDQAENLVTSCVSCNSSKYDNELSPSVLERLNRVVRDRNRKFGISHKKIIKITCCL